MEDSWKRPLGNTPGYDMQPDGLAAKFVLQTTKVNIERWFRDHKDDLMLVSEMRLPSLEQYGPETFEANVRQEILDISHNRAVFVMEVLLLFNHSLSLTQMTYLACLESNTNKLTFAVGAIQVH